MPKKTKLPLPLPGDLVQVVDQAHPLRLLVGLVVEVHKWGAGVNVPAIQGGEIVQRYERLKPAQYAVVGAAAIMPGEVYKARETALKERAAIDREKARG